MSKLLVNSDSRVQDAHALIDALYAKTKYFVLTAMVGKRRSIAQNSMDFELYGIIADQLYGGDRGLARCECKLDYGVPILLEDSEAFRTTWSRLESMSREELLSAMKFIQVSSVMTRSQQKRYIDAIIDGYAANGVVWPDYIVGGR